MKWLLLFLVVLSFTLLTVNGSNHQKANRATVARCDRHGGLYRSTYDGSDIVAVWCEDNTRFRRH